MIFFPQLHVCLPLPFFNFLLLSGFNVANWFHFSDTNVDQPVRNSVAHTTLRSKKLYYWVRHMQPVFFVHTHTVNLILIYSDTECEQSLRQGMTIRIAWLPWAGNLLGQAGEDFSGLPDQPNCHFSLLHWQYHVSIHVLDFKSLWQFSFCSSTVTSVSFQHQTDRLKCGSMWLACQCS